jgi:hypothetical protein
MLFKHNNNLLKATQCVHQHTISVMTISTNKWDNFTRKFIFYYLNDMLLLKIIKIFSREVNGLDIASKQISKFTVTSLKFKQAQLIEMDNSINLSKDDDALWPSGLGGWLVSRRPRFESRPPSRPSQSKRAPFGKAA